MTQSTPARIAGGSSTLSRRAGKALASAAVITALWTVDSASGAVNSFFPGVTFSSGVNFNDPANWSLGHVPNDPTDEIVLPPAGFSANAVTMSFDGANIVAGVLTNISNPGRVLVNSNTSTPS